MEHLQAAVLVGLLLFMCVFNESGVFLDSEVRILTLKKKKSMWLYFTHVICGR